MVDTFLLLTLARAGDQLQGIKRGILELADVIAVNKADGDGEGAARVAARELAGAMRLMMPGPAARRPPVLTCSALTGAGLDEVWSAVLEHREHLESEGSLEVRRARQQQDWMWALVDTHLQDAVRDAPSVRAQRAEVERAVRAGELSAVDGGRQHPAAVRRRPHPIAGVTHPRGARSRRRAPHTRRRVASPVTTTLIPADSGDPAVVWST